MFGLDLRQLMLLGVVAAGLVLLVASRFKAVMLVFGAMFLAASIAAPIDWQGDPIQTWMTPVQARRAELFAACGGLLLLSLGLNFFRLKVSEVSMVGITLALIGFYAGFVRTIASGDPIDGVLTIVLAVVTIFPGVLLARAVIDGPGDVVNMMRVLALVSAVWIACCFVQFMVRPRVLTLAGGGRFHGMLGNPQHAAAYLAFVTAACLYLIPNDPKYLLRFLWAGLAGVNVGLLLWTQSRTGLGMFVILTAAIFYARLGTAIIFLPIVGALVLGAWSIVGIDASDTAFRRLGEGRDTRTAVWNAMLEQFFANPLFGAGSQQEAVNSENSFLLGLAAYGVFMGVLILILFASVAYQVLTVLRLRPWLLPEERRVMDLYMGVVGAYFAGSMLEGYIVSRVSSPLVVLIIFSGIGGWLVSNAKQRQAEALFGEPGGLDDTLSGTASQPALSDSSAAYEGYEDYGDDSYDRNRS